MKTRTSTLWHLPPSAPATFRERASSVSPRDNSIWTAIKANWLKKKIKYTKVRTNRVYPMGASGMAVTFVNPTTMIFGSSEAVKAALDARDGLSPSLLDNSAIMESMEAVDSQAVWSVLDQEGTQYMMHSVLGQASQVTDYDTVKKRLLGSRYTMDFSNGVKV